MVLNCCSLNNRLYFVCNISKLISLIVKEFVACNLRTSDVIIAKCSSEISGNSSFITFSSSSRYCCVRNLAVCLLLFLYCKFIGREMFFKLNISKSSVLFIMG